MKTSFRYLLFYKPFEVLSQFSREGTKRTLADYFPELQPDIYPVGRLDYDSEGLLILTNDKRLTHRLLDPSQAHPRTYWVQVEGTLSEAALKQLRTGVTISVNGQKHRTRPALAQAIPEPVVPARNPPIRYRAAIPTSWVELTLTEGKNRQVRRMTAAVGFPTLRLIRVAIGNLQIGALQPGDWREVRPTDLF